MQACWVQVDSMVGIRHVGPIPIDRRIGWAGILGRAAQKAGNLVRDRRVRWARMTVGQVPIESDRAFGDGYRGRRPLDGRIAADDPPRDRDVIRDRSRTPRPKLFGNSVRKR